MEISTSCLGEKYQDLDTYFIVPTWIKSMRNKNNGGVKGFTKYDHSEEKHNLDSDHRHNVRPNQGFL